ncbi:MAG TPA: hypothetical protein VGM54_26430 [Chthoniobacter sp.]|jgi:hypothetical protein
MNIRRLSFFAFAVAIGVSTFGLLWLPKTMAAAAQYCNQNANVTMCYKGSTVNNVVPVIQKEYLANGGTCGPCSTTQVKL